MHIRDQFTEKQLDVEFEELEPAAYADAYLGLYEGLTELFKDRVDVVSVTAIT